MSDNTNTKQPGAQTLAEIIDALSKEIPARLLQTKTKGGTQITFISWRTAQRILDKHAPGWSGKASVSLSSDRCAVSYSISIPTSDAGDVMRTATGTEDEEDEGWGDPVTKAEQQAFKRAAARFGLGLYLYDRRGTQQAPQTPTQFNRPQHVTVPQLQSNAPDPADVPAPQMHNPDGAPTENQLKAIYAIGRAARRLSEQQVDERAVEVFGVRPAEMTKAEASQFIDMLKGEAA